MDPCCLPTRSEEIARGLQRYKGNWTPPEQSSNQAVVQLLARGSPLSAQMVAETLGIPVSRAVDLLDSPTFHNAERDPHGRIVGWSGLTLNRTPHRLITPQGAVLHTWCALDPYFLALIIGGGIAIESTDPLTKTIVRVELREGTVQVVDPPHAAATLVRETVDRLVADIRGNFCSQVNHFESRESAEHFAKGRPNVEVVGIPELAAIGQRVAQLVWGIEPPAGPRAPVTCPYCRKEAKAIMPTSSCLISFPCPHCNQVLRPRPGDCCIFCSYGDSLCPPKLDDSGP